MEAIDNIIERNQPKWFGHICKTNDKRQVKQIWETKAPNRRGRGTPQETLNDEVPEIPKKRNVTWVVAKKKASNKKEWTNLVHIVN